jgi:hypothetical protein
MVTVKVVDAEDRNDVYGLLTVKAPNVSVADVRAIIYEIKDKFRADGNDEWCATDIFELFPDDWDWSFDDREFESVVI